MNDKGYPVYQYSYFINGSRDEQLCIREDDFEKFLEAKRNIDKIIEKRKAKMITNEEPPAQSAQFTCNFCGQPAEEKRGISKKGKQYHAIFCLTKDPNHTTWL